MRRFPHPDTDKKLDLTLDWHPDSPGGSLLTNSLNYIQFDWQASLFAGDPEFGVFVEVDVLMTSPFMPITLPALGLSDRGQFFVDFRVYPTVPLRFYKLEANALGDNLKVKVAPDLYSIPWTYDFDKQSASVPEGGSARPARNYVVGDDSIL
jgi:hypothetical protein